MKNYVIAILVAGALVASAHAQSSLFDKYDVNMSKWAQLPANQPWAGETSSVAADGKGNSRRPCAKGPVFPCF